MSKTRIRIVGGIILVVALLLALSSIVFFQRSYGACYVGQYNDQWVVFEPHWEYGEMIYTISRTDPKAQPVLVVGSNKQTVAQMYILPQSGDYLAIFKMTRDGGGQVSAIRLPTKKPIWQTTVPGPGKVDSFNSSEIIYYYYYDMSKEEGNLQFRRVDTTNWNQEVIPIPNPWLASQDIVEVPSDITNLLVTKVVFCQSWPSQFTTRLR